MQRLQAPVRPTELESTSNKTLRVSYTIKVEKHYWKPTNETLHTQHTAFEITQIPPPHKIKNC